MKSTFFKRRKLYYMLNKLHEAQIASKKCKVFQKSKYKICL